MIKKQILIITLLVFSGIAIGNAQSLSDRLRKFTDKLSSQEKVEMKVFMEVLDDNRSKIDQTIIEYKRTDNMSYNKTKDVQIVQDDIENLYVTIDNESKSIIISRKAQNSDFVEQMKSMFSIFDETNGLFKISNSHDKNLSIYLVTMGEEELATYYFDQSNDWLVKVIFHKSTPMKHKGRLIDPTVDITFKYDESVKALKLKSILSSSGETWKGKGAYSRYEVQDYSNHIANY